MALGIPSLSGITRQAPWNSKPKPKPKPKPNYTQGNALLAAASPIAGKGASGPSSPTYSPTTYAPPEYLQQRAAGDFGVNMGTQQAAGQYAALDADRQALQLKQGLFEANRATQGGYMAQELDANRAHLLNKQAGLGLDRNNLANDLGLAEALGGLAQQGFNVDERGYKQAAGIDNRMLGSKGTYKDSYTSEFSRLGFKDIQDKLANQLENTGIGRKESDARLKAKRAEVANASKDIDIRANELGLDRADLERAFNQGLAKLNLDTTLNIYDVMTAINGNDFSKAQIAEQIWRQALADTPFNMNRPYTSGQLLSGVQTKRDPVQTLKSGARVQ